MTRILGAMVVAFSAVAFTQAADEKKPVGTLLIEVNATDLAKEFKEDPKAAKARYDPNPPKGAKVGGAIVKLIGPVDRSEKGGVYLKTEGTVKVFVKTATLPEKGRFAIDAVGKFKELRENKKDKTVVIEADEVKYSQIVGGK